MNMFKIIIILFFMLFIFFLSVFLYYYIGNNKYSADGKITILMSGRSTTDLWFRFWNLPGILNQISVWRNWRIPYSKYVNNKFYFEYLPIPAPHHKIYEPGFTYGDATYETIKNKIENQKFDILSFKYCFVDFGDNSINNDKEAQERFKNMVSLVEKLHALTSRKKMILILYTALPSFNPGKYAQKIRIEYNKWLHDYANFHDDIIKVELYEILADEQGRLKRKYSIDPSDADSHPNIKAFHLIEKQLMYLLQEENLK